jgi:hypothetical protein
MPLSLADTVRAACTALILANDPFRHLFQKRVSYPDGDGFQIRNLAAEAS